MIKMLLRHLLVDFLILVALLTASAILPILAFPLCGDPMGGQLVFWLGPWTCAVWVLFIVQLGGSRFWRGKAHVLAWREAHGGLLRTSIRGTLWMFGALFLSYAAELFVVFFIPRSPVTVQFFPLSTYSPLFLALWRAYRG